MNPLTNVRNITKLNENEIKLGIDGKGSWHNMYRHSAWVFIGGLNYDLTEGDVIAVFSQYGEIVHINLVRDKKTGKSKGFAFLCYEDQRSTVLAVDNLNGIKLVGRIIRVDHVDNYKMPKEHEDDDEETKRLQEEGCAPKKIELTLSPDREIVPKKEHKDRHSKGKDSAHDERRHRRSRSKDRQHKRRERDEERRPRDRSRSRSRDRKHRRDRDRSRSPKRSDSRRHHH